MPTDLELVQPIARCCPRHADWPILAQHLVDDFPDASIAEVVRAVCLAREATSAAHLDEFDSLDIGEAIARHQLALVTGSVPDVARLDPESHLHRPEPTGDAVACVRQ